MNKLINTFKYGSWKTRLFFGAIALAFLGGAATIAVAAIAGLGIIPIAVGGAALVLGIGMSTMVTVVSDDDPENPGHGENPGNGEDSRNGEDQGTGEDPGAGEYQEIGEKRDGIDNFGTGENPSKAENTGTGEIPQKAGKTGTGEIPQKAGNTGNGETSQKAGNTRTVEKQEKSEIKSNGKTGTGANANPGVSETSLNKSRDADIVNPGRNGTSQNAAEKPNGKNPAGTEKSGNIKNEVPETLEEAVRRQKSGAPETLEEAVRRQKSGAPETLEEAVRRQKSGAPETLEEAVQKEKNGVIYAEDDGRYVPDEIKENAVRKASYTMKKVNNKSRLSPSEGPFIDGLPPEKTIGELEGYSDADKGQQGGAKSADSGPEDSGTESQRKDRTNSGNAQKGNNGTGSKNGNRTQNADDQADGRQTDEKQKSGTEEKKGLFKRFASLFSRKRSPEREAAKRSKEEAKKAKEKHLLDGRKSRQKRKDIKKQVKEKTKEYGRELEEKFDNELSFAEKEKLREDQYLKDIQNRRAAETESQDSEAERDNPEEVFEREDKRIRNNRSDDGIRNEEYDPDEEAAEEENGTVFTKLGGFFKKLFGNVYDEPEDGSASAEESTGDIKAGGEPAEDNGSKDKKKKQKEKKKKDKKNAKEDKNSDGEDQEDKDNRERKTNRDSRLGNKDPEDDVPEEEARRTRLPGEDIDVTKYTSSNMKKIIKAKKLGKDFIPVFIESWESQQVEKIPALCYVKDDKVHFLLLEGDMERDVSIPIVKFINVWYKKNVQETNLRAYKNLRENMGAYEMFEDVMPAFASSKAQPGAASFTQNLYLLGNDIAVGPPTMRELRKRFRFNTNIFASLNVRGEYSDYFKKAYENRIMWTDNVIGIQEYQRRIRAILQEMVNDENLIRIEFKEEVDRMVQYRLITDEYAQFYMNLKEKA